MSGGSVDNFVRVYRLPGKLTDGFCFGGGRPITFLNADWFDVPPEAIAEAARKGTTTRQMLEDFIRLKGYFDERAAFLVISSDPALTFVIGEVVR